MTPTLLLKRARLCHRSADAIKARAALHQVTTRAAWMHELEIAESLEALAERLERQAIGLDPERRDGPR